METKIKSDLIYQGSVITVTKDLVSVDNEMTSIRECVRANGGVAVLALVDGKVLLVKQYRYVVSEETLEIPAGKIEVGEKLEVCALRELEEECGYTADKLTKLFSFYPTPGFCGETLHIFLAEGLHQVVNPKAMDEDERIEVLAIDLKQAYQMILDGTIKDSKTMIAIQHAYVNFFK